MSIRVRVRRIGRFVTVGLVSGRTMNRPSAHSSRRAPVGSSDATASAHFFDFDTGGGLRVSLACHARCE